jgi:hypothetical protein
MTKLIMTIRVTVDLDDQDAIDDAVDSLEVTMDDANVEILSSSIDEIV